ncbi:MAG: arginine--tRNA ligase [Planctomycetes bacterium]|nr:arginine--tRNA ligase [Planctomycetota bacterium]
MRTIRKVLDDAVAAALREETGEALPAAVAPSKEERFGDYQANGAMGAAKRLRRKPVDLARAVAGRLHLDEMCEAPAIAGPGFINFRLRPEWTARAVREAIIDRRAGVDRVARADRVVIDFSSPNLAKEMHVGHIRSTIIGDAIARMLAFLGHDVIRQNHVGDWGTQFGMLIAYLKERHAEALRERTLAIADLEGFYREAKSRFDADPAFQDRARAEVVALQAGDPDSRAAWAYVCDRSRAACGEIYGRLRVELEERGESFYNPLLPGMVEDLARRGIATESEGALCVFLEGCPAPFMVRKQDGGYKYETTDLAALRFRVEELGADRILYVTDARQIQHFAMLFRAARLAGYAPDRIELRHIPFGMVLGEDGKPLKTRSGENIRLRQLLDEAQERARAIVDAKSPDLPPEERARIARIVGIGSIKYADLSQNVASDYVFSWDKMLAMDGNTAPYLQYAYARVSSIFRKGDVDRDALRENAPAVRPDAPEELALAKCLLRFPEAVETAAEEYRPSAMSAYLYDLAWRFTGFYGACPVLQAEPGIRESRLLLALGTAERLRLGLDLLGIEVNERM